MADSEQRRSSSDYIAIDYCTNKVNSARGGTGDRVAEILMLATWVGTGDRSRISSMANSGFEN